jgi:hypothetical protein
MHNPYQFPQDGIQSEDAPAVTDGKAKVEIMAGAPVGSTRSAGAVPRGADVAFWRKVRDGCIQYRRGTVEDDAEKR